MDNQATIHRAVVGILAVLVITVLFTAITACDETPTEPTPKPTVEYRIVVEGLPPSSDTLNVGDMIPIEFFQVEQRVGNGPWELFLGALNARMHVTPQNEDPIRVVAGDVPGTNDGVLLVWSSARPFVVPHVETLTFEATADNPLRRAITPVTRRWAVRP